MKATIAEIGKYLKSLEETPHRIKTLTQKSDEMRLQAKLEKTSWSANDILAHLRACADLWAHSMYAMLAEKEPEFSDINECKWAKVTGYADLPFVESFQAYSLQRENLIRVFKRLPLEEWERSALIFGRKHTVFTQARRMAKHEMEHLEQMESLLKYIDCHCERISRSNLLQSRGLLCQSGSRCSGERASRLLDDLPVS